MSDLTVIIVIGGAILISLVFSVLGGEKKPPKRPVQFWGDDGQWHYLPGEDPEDNVDPSKEYWTPHDV